MSNTPDLARRIVDELRFANAVPWNADREKFANFILPLLVEREAELARVTAERDRLKRAVEYSQDRVETESNARQESHKATKYWEDRALNAEKIARSFPTALAQPGEVKP